MLTSPMSWPVQGEETAKVVSPLAGRPASQKARVEIMSYHGPLRLKVR
jgi:hypothetical protein